MRLSEEERETLSKLGTALVGKSSISGICAYGSKVAGYARGDSDYDLILVCKRFREGVRYKYVDSPVPVSALIVDEELLWEDARTSYMGEFVAGRFLNAYEPISNEQLFRAVELEYKKRVLMEALLELSSDYGDFSRHLLVPYDYFLFYKLSRRAALYPPATYSYVQTYTCPLGSENRAQSMAGFAGAAASLSGRAFLKVGPDGVRVVPEKLRGDAFTKAQSIFTGTTRGVTQYAIHGYAGRVGLGVFRREAQSKLKRMRENPPPLLELERPRSLLRLEEGKVIPDASLLEKQLAGLLGFDRYSTKERFIGEPYSTTRVLTFRDSGREASVVVKTYTDVRSLKWALLGIWASATQRFSMAPMARLDREYGMSLRLKAAGLSVPSVLAVAPEERVLVKEFVSGPTLASVIDSVFKGKEDGLAHVSAYGALLASAHEKGLAIGDAKASNVVVSEKGLYLTDLEQAQPSGDKAWDLAEFLYYTSKLSVKEDAMRKVAESFLQAYVKGGDRPSVAKAMSSKYYRPFQPFLTPGMAKMLRETMGAYAYALVE
ncbi:MAG: hypothetical protein HY247_03215 [archaeon]|nr:MAG: hypothetical protein HY247_03215 [archaeon]